MAEPKFKSLFDIPPNAATEAAADAAADAEIEAGLGVPHERVRAWLFRLARGEKLSPPTA